MNRFPTLEETTAEDYAALGLMSGLEIHQQLATRRKLFCRCPAHSYLDAVHAEVLRHMRPTLSELGEYDGTALMEFKTKKEIVYRINRGNICTYELDDAPPFELNQQALEYCLEICLMFGCSIVGEVHIARKQYLDGSIPTGFQRSAIVGLDGAIPFSTSAEPDRVVRVQQISIEEDSGREVSDVGHRRVYSTGRLGVPLIEVVTKPDMRTPQEVGRAAQEVRKLTRASRRAQTGIGTARQDVNVSIEGGTRVEIKGVHRIPLIPALVHYEAFRQKALLSIRAALLAAGVTRDGWEPVFYDLTDRADAIPFGPLRQVVKHGGRLAAICLPAPFEVALNTPTAPGRTFADEVSDRVRVVACLDRLPNILHLPDPRSPLSQGSWELIRQAACARQPSAIVLVWGPEEDVLTARQEIVDRCREALDGVPKETRQSFLDGTTGFERILPGADRMYPDTDLPPSALTDDRVWAARQRLPPPSWEQERRLAAAGVAPHLATEIVMEGLWDLASEALAMPGVSGTLVGEVLVERVRQQARAGVLGTEGARALPRAGLLALLRRLGARRLSREAVPALLRRMAALEVPDEVEALLDAYAPPSEAAIERCVQGVMNETWPRTADPEARFRFWMGRVMNTLAHRAPGPQVARLLRVRLAEGGRA